MNLVDVPKDLHRIWMQEYKEISSGKAMLTMFTYRKKQEYLEKQALLNEVEALKSKLDLAPRKDQIETYRRLVRYSDLNHGGNLFGGSMMQWADEAAALYAICQFGTPSAVTVKASEIVFKEPVNNGDFLVFLAHTADIGTTSITVGIEVIKKGIGDQSPNRKVLTCDFKFVKIDPLTKKPAPHGLKKE